VQAAREVTRIARDKGRARWARPRRPHTLGNVLRRFMWQTSLPMQPLHVISVSPVIQ